MLIIRLFACAKSLLLFTGKKQYVFTHNLYTALKQLYNHGLRQTNPLIIKDLFELHTDLGCANNNNQRRYKQIFNYYYTAALKYF